MSTKNFAEQWAGDSLCFLTPRLGGDIKQNGSILKDTRVFPSVINKTQQICWTDHPFTTSNHKYI